MTGTRTGRALRRIAGIGASAAFVLGLAIATLAPAGSASAQSRPATAAPAAAARERPVVPRVERILVEGNRRLDDSTIKAYMVVREGEPASAAEINESLRRLLDTGLFEDVSISPLGDGLLVQVTEAPFINRVAFEGNDAISDELLASAVQSVSRAAFSRATAERDTQTILEMYRRTGRYGATVNPVIINRDNNRVDLVFEIHEGETTGVRSIDFVGNEVFSDRRLRGVIETQESGLLGFIFATDTYDPDRLEVDKEQLRRYYLDNGYADFRVLSATAELTADREDFLLTFTVEEGEPYVFGDLDIAVDLPGIDVEGLGDIFVMKPGDSYSATDVDKSIDALLYQLGLRGYTFIDVRPRARKRGGDERAIDVTLQVGQGPRVYVERIEIEGNSRTVDRVLRRQFLIAEGDAYDAREVDDARGRLRSLGFFKTVDVQVERGSADDRAVIRVNVEEQLTGSISFGVGFSSADGPVGDVSISESNFLGRGQFVQARVNVSGRDQLINFSFEEPALLDRDLAVGFSIGFNRVDNSDESSYQEDNVGFRPYVEFPLSEAQRLRLRYRLSQDKIRDVPFYASPAIREDEGTSLTSSVGATWSYDVRNDPIEPTKGYLLSLSQDFAGLGGDAQYSATTARAKLWQGFLDNQIVAAVEFEAGGIVGFGRDLLVTERYFLGGNSFRGFKRAGIGPRDTSTTSILIRNDDGTIARDPVTGKPVGRTTLYRNDALGGNYFGIVRSDLSFPLGLPEELGIYGGVFADVGTVWKLDRTVYPDGRNGPDVIDDSLKWRASVGVNLFVDSAFGPLRFTFGYPVLREDEDQTEFFRFSAGTRF